jgi:phage RecT family recombinase
MGVASKNPSSLQQAITNVAAIGLSLNPAEKLAYLIPRNSKQGDKWISKIYLEPSYMGLIRLATNSGSIKWIQANCVYENDDFIDNGAGEKPIHTYKAFSKERGEFVGVYATAKTKDGDYLSALIDAEAIYDIRGRSETYKKYQKGTWITDFAEMAKKAVIRRLFKTLPLTDENARMAHAVDLSNDNEGFSPIVSNPDIGEFSPDQKEYFDQMIEQGDGLGMTAFQKSLEERTFSNLYHSFEKGNKGKYQKVVDELLKKGAGELSDYVIQLNDCAEIDDECGAGEILSELTDEKLTLVKSSCSSDALMFLSRMEK